MGKEIRVTGVKSPLGELSFKITRTSEHAMEVEVCVPQDVKTLFISLPMELGEIGHVNSIDKIGNQVSLESSAFQCNRITFPISTNSISLRIGLVSNKYVRLGGNYK
jgi:hypothetical protein